MDDERSDRCPMTRSDATAPDRCPMKRNDEFNYSVEHFAETDHRQRH